MRRLTTSLVFGLVFSSTTSSVFALQQSYYVTHQNDVATTGAPTVSTKDATKVIHGDFSGHGARDVVYQFEDEACLFYAPGGLRLAMTIPGLDDFEDLCSVPPGADSSQDRIAATDAHGLWLWSYSKYTGQWSSVKQSGVNDPHWIGAKLLRRADIDGDGIDDLIGVHADQKGILIGYCDAQGVLDTQFGPTFPRVLLDLTVGNVDSDPAAELCGLQDNGVKLMDIDGTPLFFMRDTQSGYAVTTLRRAGELDQFAWITHASLTPTTILYAINATTFEPPVDLGSDVGRAIVAADFDGDGNDDVLVSNSNTGLRRLYHRIAGVPSFSVADSHLINIESIAAPGANTADAAFADLDGDEVPEIVGFSVSSGLLRVLERDEPVEFDPENPPSGVLPLDPCDSFDTAIVGANFMSEDLGDSSLPGVWEGNTSELELLVDRDAWNFAGIPALNAFEVYVYKQHLAGPSTMTVSHNVRTWEIFMARNTGPGTFEAPNTRYLTGAGARAEHALRIPLTFGPIASQQPMPEMDWLSANQDYRFYVEIRACTYTPSPSGGTITNRKRLFKYGISGSPASSAGGTTQTLETFALGQANGAVLPFNCTAYEASTGGQIGGIKIGGYVALSSLPDFTLSPVEWPPIHLTGTY